MSFRTTNSTNENGMNRQIDHYVHLFWRKLWFILPISVAVMAGYFLLISNMGFTRPQLEATAILQFENSDDLSAVQERVGLEPDAKAVLMKSRSFLEGVVRKLSLQVQVSQYPRSLIFDSVFVDIDAAVGNYKLHIKNDTYILYYSDRFNHNKKNVIQNGKISSLNNLTLPGLHLHWSSQFLSEPFEVKFSVVRLRDAIDNIVHNLVVKTTGKDATIMSVSMMGKDYEVITDVVNTIADDFVQENSLTKRSRKSEVVDILKKQLETARGEMLNAEVTLRRFREANPTVGLADAFSPPVKIMDLRETEAELKAALLQSQGLQERYRVTVDSMRPAVLNEMVSFLNRYQTATAQALQSELDLLSSQSQMLKNDYSPMHPLALKNRESISILGNKVVWALTDLMNQLSRKVRENNTRIDKINTEISRLPSKELQLSNLQRRYDVNSEIYSNVLTRYNEAKIAKAVEIGDVYVIDHAVVPEDGSDPKTLVALVGIGLLLGFSAGFGPVLTVDLFDKTARTEKDLRRMTDLVLLESIPVKGSWGRSRASEENKTVDGKLVAIDYTHNYVDETYRSLRAKVLLSLHEEKRKRILVTSLNMGEGKSFTAANLAITMAQQRISTLLIDGDLRRGIQHLHFGLDKRPGLSNILADSLSINASYLQPALQSTHISHLTMIGSGSSVPNSAELLNSTRFRELINLLSNNFEMIILDTPPLAVTTDAIGIQDTFQKYVVIVRAGHTNISELNRKTREYPGLRKKVLGIVFNGAPYRRTEYYQYASYKY